MFKTINTSGIQTRSKGQRIQILINALSVFAIIGGCMIRRACSGHPESRAYHRRDQGGENRRIASDRMG